MPLYNDENAREWLDILNRLTGKFYLPGNVRCNWFVVQLCSTELFLFYIPFALEEFYIISDNSQQHCVYIQWEQKVLVQGNFL